MKPLNFFNLKSYDCCYQDIFEIQLYIKELIDNYEDLDIHTHENDGDYDDWCTPLHFDLIDNIYSLNYGRGNFKKWDLICRMDPNLNYHVYVRITAEKYPLSKFNGSIYQSPDVKTFVNNFLEDTTDKDIITERIRHSIQDDATVVQRRAIFDFAHHPNFISYDGNVKNAVEMWKALKDIPYHNIYNHTDLYWKPEQVREFKINFGLVDRMYFLKSGEENCLPQNIFTVIRMQRCQNTSMSPLYIVIFVTYGGDDPTQVRYYSRLHFTCSAYSLVNLLDNIDTRERVSERLKMDEVI